MNFTHVALGAWEHACRYRDCGMIDRAKEVMHLSFPNMPTEAIEQALAGSIKVSFSEDGNTINLEDRTGISWE